MNVIVLQIFADRRVVLTFATTLELWKSLCGYMRCVPPASTACGLRVVGSGVESETRYDNRNSNLITITRILSRWKMSVLLGALE